jgi:hypothetical protein
MNKGLVIVIVLQLLILAGQWLGAPTVAAPAGAAAQDFNPGRDRIQMLDEMKATNAKLDRLIDILESGELQVKTVSPDDNKAKAPAR